MTDVIELAKVFGATSALLIVAIVVLWRHYLAEIKAARERNASLTDQMIGLAQDYAGYTTKSTAAFERLTDILKARGGA